MAETYRLKAVLGDLLVTIDRIGSTAIPGIMAKPIVDMVRIFVDALAWRAAQPTD